MIPFCNFSLSARFLTSSGGTILSAVPFISKPDEGQGARKPKSWLFAGGAAAMIPVDA